MEEEAHGRKAAARKEAKDKRRVAKVKTGRAGTCGKTGHIAAWSGKGGKKNLYAVDEDDSEDTKEYSNRSTESEEDLQAWCILEESESEQWQEVISRRSRQRAKKTNQASLLSVESRHDLSPKKIVEVKDKWVKVGVTMDSGAAGHVMPESMFPLMSRLSARHRRKSLWQQMESKSRTWVRREFHSRQTRAFRGA